MGIDAADPLGPHQRRDQHEQRRFRQVEIGHKPVRDVEAEPRPDEDPGHAAKRRDGAGGGGRAFDQAQRRGAHRDHAPAPGARGGDGGGGLGRHLAPFLVHPVILDPVGLDRQEGARAHMQRHMHPPDPARRERVQKRRIEMERGRGRRHRARGAGPDGLIVLAVGGVGRAQRGDIGRQRHLARGLERGIEGGAGQVEAQEALVARAPVERGVKAGGKDNHLAGRDLAQRPEQRRPGAVRHRRKQRDLDPGKRRAAQALPRQPRRNHTRVVQHQKVAGPQDLRQVGHLPVGDGVPLGHEQARRRTRPGRSGGDQIGRQVEIEV